MADSIKGFYATEYSDTLRYIDKMSRYGVTKFAPVIITCAITGGLHGKEANPNLPETPEEQAVSARDAYNAGAAMIHIHARDPQDWSKMSQNWEDFAKVNRMVRENCPELIINNTMIGGHMIDVEKGTVGGLLTASVKAKPEVASLDLNCIAVDMPRKGRKPPLTGGTTEDHLNKFYYMMTPQDAKDLTKMMVENGIKPEFEVFSDFDIKLLREVLATGYAPAPYWINMLFNGNGTFPTPENMAYVTKLIPENALFSCIGIGAAQFPMVALAMIFGHHVRVGLEDNVFYGPRVLADSNAQLVERAVRIANELGRPIATPAQAREMMGLGAPRAY